MDTARRQLVKQLFHDALDQPESARRGFLAATCRADRQLYAEVESLLAAHEGAAGFLESPTGGDAGGGAEQDAGPEIRQQLQRVLAGRYSLQREIGRGGMAIVYLARDVALDRPVAVKLLPPRFAAAPDYRERFLREARTAAGLSHPHIVPIHLVEERDGLVYFVLAFVEGESLGDRVRRAGPLKPADAARLVQEVAWALAYAHGRGVIHRDIKPDNILIDKGSGRALVSDFGIARVTGTGTVSRQGDVLGTLAYMSPEQASAESVIDGRADLYSLGVTAFFALTGRLPFDSQNPAALMAMHLAEPAPPVRSVSGVIPPRLAEAIDRCLAKDPAARYPSGEALAEAIADAQLTRREIAPSVREFLGAAKSGAVQAVIIGMMWMGLGVSGVADETLFAIVMQVMLTAITPLVLIHPLLSARGVLRAGLDQRDVAEAVASASTMRDANIEYELARASAIANWLSRPWARAIFLAAAVPLVFIFPRAVSDMISAGVSLEALGIVIYLLLAGGADVFFLGMVIAPKTTVATLTRGTPENAGFLRKLWGGRLGRWLFKLAGIGLKKPKSLPVPDSAPTEVLLGRAAAELFEQLPKDQRARLGDVQDVIGGLERAATALRVRRDALHKGLAEAGTPGGFPRRAQLVAELETARSAVERRLATAVAALENLRLDLLRLRAGVGSPDDLTVSIEEARSVGEAVDVELAARREVESATRR